MNATSVAQAHRCVRNRLRKSATSSRYHQHYSDHRTHILSSSDFASSTFGHDGFCGHTCRGSYSQVCLMLGLMNPNSQFRSIWPSEVEPDELILCAMDRKLAPLLLNFPTGSLSLAACYALLLVLIFLQILPLSLCL